MNTKNLFRGQIWRVCALLTACGGADSSSAPEPKTAETQPENPTPSNPTPTNPAPKTDSIVGTWIYRSAQGQVTMVLAADGSGTFNGAAFKYTFGGGKFVATGNGQSMSYDAVLEGDALTLSGGNLPAPVLYTRETGSGTPASASGIVGSWKYSNANGTLTLSLRADGSGSLNGTAFRYTFVNSKLIASANNASMTYDAVLNGDSLTLSGGDLTAAITFTRQAAPPVVTGPMADVAGVWVAEESSLDPQFYLSYTQYVTLYPNGSVSYQKAEGSATRTQVTETLERFRSSTETGDVYGDAGTWETDGASITVRWSKFNGLVSEGQVDLAANQLTLSRMGVLESGTTLTFKREK